MTAESIVKFVLKKLLPIQTITTYEEAQEFLSSWDSSLIAFFEGGSKKKDTLTRKKMKKQNKKI
jgi:hypothetical protein